MKVRPSKRMKNHTSELRDKGDRISYGPTELKNAYIENKRECFIRVSKHEETDESTRPQAKSLYCFKVLGYPGCFPFEQKFRFEIPKISCDEWNSIFRLVASFFLFERDVQVENEKT